MPFLKDLRTQFHVPFDFDTAVEKVLLKLHFLGLEFKKVDRAAGEIIVWYLTMPINWGLWRCYSNQVLVEVEQRVPGSSLVKVFTIPSFGGRPSKGEVVRDVSDVLFELEQLGNKEQVG